MWKFSSFIFFLGAAISLKQVFAISDEAKEAFTERILPIAKACAEELGADMATIEELKKTHSVDPCFIACVLKKDNVLKDGVIDIGEAMERVKSYVHDQADIEAITEISEECASEANEADLSDDDKDCERAGLFTHCIREKKAGGAL